MKNYLSVKELAQEMGIGRDAAYALVKRADFFPAARIGKNSIVVSRALLDEWIRTIGHDDINRP